jgi:hypothetical protein
MTTVPRFAPDATGEGSCAGDDEPYLVTIDGKQYSTAHARRLGFVPAQTSGPGCNEYVQANGFQVRGLIRRGDAQKFNCGELRELVRRWLVERGVEIEFPDVFEAFTFNHRAALDLDQARERATQEMTE